MDSCPRMSLQRRATSPSVQSWQAYCRPLKLLQLHRLGPSFLTSTGRRTDGLMGCRGAQKRQGEIGADEGAERREEHIGRVVRVFDHCKGSKYRWRRGGGGVSAASWSTSHRSRPWRQSPGPRRARSGGRSEEEACVSTLLAYLA